MSEVKVYTVAIGNAPMPWASRKVKKSAEKAINFIKELDGFIGVNPQPPRGTLCLFRTENDAKIARNRMNAEGIRTGDNICECYIDERYVGDAEWTSRKQ